MTESQAEGFEYTEAVCIAGFSTFRHPTVARGAVYPIDHWVVAQHPEFFRVLGPRPDALKGRNVAAA